MAYICRIIYLGSDPLSPSSDRAEGGAESMPHKYIIMHLRYRVPPGTIIDCDTFSVDFNSDLKAK